jgi:hypothetical protein
MDNKNAYALASPTAGSKTQTPKALANWEPRVVSTLGSE